MTERACPVCGTANAADARFCNQCGAAFPPAGPGLQAPPAPPPAPAPGNVPGPPPVPGPGTVPGPAPGFGPAPTAAAPTGPLPEQPEGYQLSQRGQRYGAGYGPTFYGVWDLRTGGSPVAWFDRTPAGWDATWRRFQELEGASGLPSWRRAAAGWVLLHLLIGIGIWIAQLILLGIVLTAAFGPDRAQEIQSLPQDEQSTFGGAAMLALLTSMLGWMLFVYLRSSTKLRGWVLVGVLAVGFAVLVAVGLAVVPE